MLSMMCICDVWEECHERSEGVGTVSRHELGGIEKGKEQECRRYGQREMRQLEQERVVRGVARYRGRRLSIRSYFSGMV